MVTIDARAGKWLAVALFVSVGINLLLGGWAIGKILAQDRRVDAIEERSGAGRAVPYQRLLATLPEGDRAAMEAAFAKRRPEIAAAQQALRQARARVATTLTAERFDAAAQRQAFADLRARNAAMQQVFHDALTEVAQQLPAATRQQIVERWERRRGR